MAGFPSARHSPMIPDPTIAASSAAVLILSAMQARGSGTLRGKFWPSVWSPFLVPLPILPKSFAFLRTHLTQFAITLSYSTSLFGRQLHPGSHSSLKLLLLRRRKRAISLRYS
jgi:hypothetical protein